MAHETCFERYRKPQSGKRKWRCKAAIDRVVGEPEEGYARQRASPRERCVPASERGAVRYAAPGPATRTPDRAGAARKRRFAAEVRTGNGMRDSRLSAPARRRGGDGTCLLSGERRLAGAGVRAAGGRAPEFTLSDTGPAPGDGEPGAPAATPRVEPAQPQAGESREFDGIEFVWVPAGEFLMGSTSSEAGDDGRPLTRVRIRRGYWLGKYEVTQAQWRAVMGSNPSHFTGWGCGNCPVEKVSWEDAQEFIRRLNRRSGGDRYRLPREAEWEYAARAGTSGDRYGNVDAVAWYSRNSGGRTHPVGRKAPNAWGLYDMLGNVWEWVEDWYEDHLPGGTVTDPRGPGSGTYRLNRGGCWHHHARYCRAPNRDFDLPGTRADNLGFRLLRTEWPFALLPGYPMRSEEIGGGRSRARPKRRTARPRTSARGPGPRTVVMSTLPWRGVERELSGCYGLA